MDNLNGILEIDMMEPTDSEIVHRIISAKPFPQVDGGINTRDLSDPTYTELKPGYAFRSGSLERLTAQSQEDLVMLGVKTVFDLRSPAEVAKNPDPSIDGVDIVIAIPDEKVWNKMADAKEFTDLASMYVKMLQTHKSGYRRIL